MNCCLIKKIVLIGVMALIISCVFTLGLSDAEKKKYLPSWFGESWESNWGDDQANILQNFWLSLTPFADKGDVDPYADADVYGWYKDAWFGLANWEREVCLADLSSDVRSFRNAVEDSAVDSWSIYTTTVTVSATKGYGINDSYLYEVSWYIKPYGGDALYRVYLRKGNSKYYFAGKKGTGDDKWVTVSRYVGDANYKAQYLNMSYSEVVLEYRDAGSEAVDEFVVSVVDKDVFPEGYSDGVDSGEAFDPGK